MCHLERRHITSGKHKVTAFAKEPSFLYTNASQSPVLFRTTFLSLPAGLARRLLGHFIRANYPGGGFRTFSSRPLLDTANQPRIANHFRGVGRIGSCSEGVNLSFGLIFSTSASKLLKMIYRRKQCNVRVCSVVSTNDNSSRQVVYPRSVVGR